MDTWAIMSHIKCGYTTLLEVYLQQEEARERTEMFHRKLQKARAQYALTHPYSDSETDDESYEAEKAKKHSGPKNADEKNDSDEQAKANKTLAINKIYSQNGKGSANEPTLVKQKETTATAAEIFANQDDSSADSVVEVVKEPEIIDLCTPERKSKPRVAPYNVTPTSSKRRNTRRRLKLD